ncbi:ComF family protein [Alkalibacterium pelagium]|jgi:competence protein ComFC|uniref:Competence protein ComFC n=1 Tax=Alkalibacterium pelagium TaxID=426702 RepID=A0A1H7F654_9LACT|nr:phosphoribosyltransferase family protein [Alkalibacterium pelagium]SEK18655.1 competence protein ComFC [Alkalibacterium pelagium]
MSRCKWCGAIHPNSLTIHALIRFELQSDTLCFQCREKLECLNNQLTCRGCSRNQNKTDYCTDCLSWQKKYEGRLHTHEALYAYNDFASQIIEQFKFTGDCAIAELFAKEIKEYFKKMSQTAVIIPIPVSRESYCSRGFNQTELLLAVAGVTYRPVLENRYQLGRQSGKNRRQRLESPQPFAVEPCHDELIRGKAVVLVDDIYTTGRTIYHALDLILPMSPSNVQSFSLFR